MPTRISPGAIRPNPKPAVPSVRGGRPIGLTLLCASKGKAGTSQQQNIRVGYGQDWYAATRQASKSTRTVRDELGGCMF